MEHELLPVVESVHLIGEECPFECKVQNDQLKAVASLNFIFRRVKKEEKRFISDWILGHLNVLFQFESKVTSHIFFSCTVLMFLLSSSRVCTTYLFAISVLCLLFFFLLVCGFSSATFQSSFLFCFSLLVSYFLCSNLCDTFASRDSNFLIFTIQLYIKSLVFRNKIYIFGNC